MSNICQFAAPVLVEDLHRDVQKPGEVLYRAIWQDGILHTGEARNAVRWPPAGAHLQVKILLPYERDPIDALGCTVEEYEDYRKSLINYGKRRPAAYDHIPDVRMSRQRLRSSRLLLELR